MKSVYCFVTRRIGYAVLLLLFIFGGFTSCVSPKKVIYFQGSEQKSTTDKITTSYVPTIQPNDLLSVVVGSLNPEANELFNLPTGGGTGAQVPGYLVDAEGNIQLPLVGKIKIVGLTTQDAADTVRKYLTKYIRDPTVSIRTLNYQVSVLGEVSNPGVYVIADEKVTLPKAISLAGDLTIFGRRDNILIIREEDGKREYARVDFTSRDFFNSPYYYLHKNDMVYVEPIPSRMNSTSNARQNLSLVLGTVSAVAALVLLLFRI